MIYLQILVSLFVLMMLVKLFKQKQANKISSSGLLVWLVIWLIVLLVFWQPESTSYLANILGIGRGVDLAIYVSIIVVFYMLFRIFVRLNKIDSEITKLVRKDSLKDEE